MILPMDNAVYEPEFYDLRLRGVASYTVRLATKVRAEMPTAGIEASAVFNETAVDVIGYGCAETSFLDGQDANVAISTGITERTGLPAVTATEAMLEALRALDVDSVAVAAPYRAASATALETYLERGGVQVVGMESQDFSEGSSDPREWYATNLQPPSTAYRMARRADSPRADAVLIAATNLRSLEVIADLEADLAKPVVSTNSALLWALLGRCGVRVDDALPGRLAERELPGGGDT